jgi:hypothetical protein
MLVFGMPKILPDLSAKKTSPADEEICRACIKTDQGAVHHG